MDWIWKTIVVFLIGKFALRFSGRKSVSQLTITQSIAMIGMGTLLVHPITNKSILITFFIILLMVILAIIIEYLSMKFDFLETFFTGKSLIVVENGKINTKNMKKLRMSVDKLEIRLRQAGISTIEDVEYATIEISGQLGYKLKEGKEPLTKGDFLAYMNKIYGRKISKTLPKSKKNNIFNEIKTNTYEGNKNEP